MSFAADNSKVNPHSGFYARLKDFQGKPDVDLFSGAFTFNYPLWLPEGRNDIEAKLSLSYSSNNKGFETFLAQGWTLPSNSIFRTPKKGINNMYSENHFSADVFGNYEELVLIDAANNVYAPIREGSFSKYQFQNNKWIMTDNKGVIYTFGTTASTRQTDPNNAAHVYKWLLERVEDKNGNFMSLSYFIDQGQVYPDTIRYTGNGTTDGIYEVKFIRESKSPFTSYMRSFPVTTAYRIDRIDVNSYHSGTAQLIRSYDLSYIETNTIVHFLSSITIKNGVNMLPATQFAYYDGTETDTGKRVGLMKQVTFPEGGKEFIKYQNSAALRNQDGSARNPMPFNVNLVKEVSRQASSTAPFYSTQYLHEGGNYYFDTLDAYNREYAGFQKVTITDPDGNVRKVYFHQSSTSANATTQGEFEDHIAKKGKMYREEQYDNAGNLYSTKIYKWNKITLTDSDPALERNFIYLERVTEASYDGNADNKAKATTYEYDTYGNTSKVTDYGEVNLSTDDGSFTDVGNDKIEMTMSYALDTADNIVSLPSEQISKDQSNNIIADKKLYYDSLAFGQVNKGNQTKTETLIEPNRWITETKVVNAFGLPTQITDARNNTTQIAYDSNNLFVASTTNALNQTSSFTYDYPSGQVVLSTDPNGVKTENSYDVFGRMSEIKQSTEDNVNTLASIKTYMYNTSVFPNSVTETVSAQGKQVAKIDYIDGFGNGIQSKQQTGTSAYSVSSTDYDARGNVAKKYLPQSSSSSAYESPSGTYESITYDALNRVKTIQNSILGTSSIAYDQWGKSVTDFKGKVKDYAYDSRENLIAVKEHLGSSVYTTNYFYNPLNNLIKITDADGNIQERTYDLRGKTLSESPFHSPAVSVGTKTFTYDNNGNILSKTDLKSQTTNYVYDALNRITSEQGNSTMSYSYDSGFIGKINTITDPDVTKHFVYDHIGRVLEEQKTIDGTQYNTGFSYDLLGNLLSVTYPNSTQITYGYDDALRMKSVTQGLTSLVSNVSYSPAQAITRIDYGNGTFTENAFDTLNCLTQKSLKNSSNTIQNIDYTYDSVGNILSANEVYNSISKNRSYTYDDLYRLTQTGETINGTAKTYSYSYNSIGNMLSNSEVGSYSYGGNHPHAVSQAGTGTYTYDANGDMLISGTWAYTWNDRGEMTHSVGGNVAVDYTYDETGTRVKKVSTTTEIVGEGENQTTNQIVKTSIYVNDYFDKDDGVGKLYVMMGNTKIATIENGVITYHHSDHLSSANVDLDSTGAVIEYVNYKPYGSVNEQTGNNKNKYKFTGKELDGDTNLYYYEARYYNSDVGRFISVDPWGGDMNDPQTLNKYAYTLNNPIKYVDPTGEKVELVSRGLDGGSSKIKNFIYKAAVHTFLRITPDNPEDFSQKNSYSFTLGGYYNETTGHLTKGQNFSVDPNITNNMAKEIQVIKTPKGLTDTEFIQKIQGVYNSYDNSLPYDARARTGVGYNCNNFSTTLIEKSGAEIPQKYDPVGVNPGLGKSIDFKKETKKEESSSAKKNPEKKIEAH